MVWAGDVRRPFGEQDLGELLWLTRQMRGCRSVLEIGSRFGATLAIFAIAMGPGARLRSIDLGHSEGIESAPSLVRVVGNLNENGWDADVIFADSQSTSAIKWARAYGPYDLIFIDGGHDYQAVCEDWHNYSEMGCRVAFHDIARERCGVPLLWREIKAQFRTAEVDAGVHMGIGLVPPYEP